MFILVSLPDPQTFLPLNQLGGATGKSLLCRHEVSCFGDTLDESCVFRCGDVAQAPRVRVEALYQVRRGLRSRADEFLGFQIEILLDSVGLLTLYIEL